MQRYIAENETLFHKKSYIKLRDITYPEDPSESCIKTAIAAWISSRAGFGVHTGWTWHRKLFSGKPLVLTTARQPSQAKCKFFQSNKSFFNFEITGGKFILWNWWRWGEILTWVPYLFRPHKIKCILQLFNHGFLYFKFQIWHNHFRKIISGLIY